MASFFILWHDLVKKATCLMLFNEVGLSVAIFMFLKKKHKGFPLLSLMQKCRKINLPDTLILQ